MAGHHRGLALRPRPRPAHHARVPGGGAGVQRDPDRRPIPVTALAADHRSVPLHELLQCELSMYLLTEPLPDGSVMVGGTTPVQEIRALHSLAAQPPGERA